MLRKIINTHSIRFLAGVILAAIFLFISVYHYHNLKAAVFFFCLFIGSGLINIQESVFSKKVLSCLYALWLVFSAVATLFFTQFVLNELFPEKGIIQTVLGVLLILAIYLLGLAVTNKIRVTTTVISAAMMIFACLNYFVYLFRGSEIAPADILSIGTAGNVVAQYSFTVPRSMFYSIGLFIAYYFISFGFPEYIPDNNTRLRIRSICASAACAVLLVLGSRCVAPHHFRQSGSAGNGCLLNFVLLFKQTFVAKPEGYAPEKVDKISEMYQSQAIESKNLPDIIVVMDESFADFDILGNSVRTDVEVTPFIDSLNDNVTKGYALSSVFGGGTPNSEYEFLSGNTMMFLPTGAICYQQFIKGPTYSLAWYLRSLGYSTTAMHPGIPNSWMRDRIWPYLGFDECYFEDDFPRQKMMRGFVSDEEKVEKIEDVYSKHIKASNEPVFIFGVTIQNHGSFDYDKDDFTNSISLVDYSGFYDDVEQYLTLIHETDLAMQELIDYCSSVERDVVVLFYGDHYPCLDNGFFEEVHGGSFNSLDEQTLQYEVPFFIWTNYKSEEETIELTSLDYLSTYLFEKAGIEQPSYNCFLKAIREVVPAMNSRGYFSSEAGHFKVYDEAEGEEKEALRNYHYLEYNCLFDGDNLCSLFSSYIENK